jgi:hypothetical protein
MANAARLAPEHPYYVEGHSYNRECGTDVTLQ